MFTLSFLVALGLGVMAGVAIQQFRGARSSLRGHRALTKGARKSYWKSVPRMAGYVALLLVCGMAIIAYAMGSRPPGGTNPAQSPSTSSSAAPVAPAARPEPPKVTPPAIRWPSFDSKKTAPPLKWNRQ